jgi:hypothetical protein
VAQRQLSRTSGFRRLSRAIDPARMYLFAALAEKERALISTRTRHALSAAKARGVTLGNPRLHVARKSAVDAVKSEADRYAANVLPIIREAQKAGARTLREIAEALVGLKCRPFACGRNRVAFRPKRTPDGRQARRDQSLMIQKRYRPSWSFASSV